MGDHDFLHLAAAHGRVTLDTGVVSWPPLRLNGRSLGGASGAEQD